MKLLIVVTHLLGSGHLSRALTLGRAFANAGHQVTLASGGLPVSQLNAEHIDVVQLPPLQSDGVNFTRLLDKDGQIATPQYLENRRAAIVKTLEQLHPDVLITELFPFGRRSLKQEFQSLLEQAKAISTPLILASIRDILAPPSKPAKAVFAEEMIQQFYDGVLVHSNADLVPLSLSWPVSSALESHLKYTGFVAPPKPEQHPSQLGKNEIIVSAGGGNVGGKLFDCAVQAAALNPDQKWRILVGGSDAPKLVAELKSIAPSNALVEAARPDFRQMLHHATASVSMCGYNTALDVLLTGVPAVFVPFDAGGEVEQSLRAEALAKQPNIVVLKDTNLTAHSLISAIRQNIKSPAAKTPTKGFDGAANTVQIVEALLKERASP